MRPLILALLIAIAAMLFALKNDAVVNVWLFGYNKEYSLALIIIITLLVGVIVGLLAATKSIWKKRSENNKQKKQISALEKQITDLQKSGSVIVPTQIPPKSEGPTAL